MREIKFRAWDKALEQWVDPNGMGITLSGTPIAPDKAWLKHDLVELRLLQYTRLKDKNGKEIYEGDVVETWMGAPWQEDQPILIHGVVRWEADGWFFSGRETNGEDDYLAQFDDLEVIGNIYENPELLKEAE